MNKTIKIKHNLNLTEELKKAIKVAQFAIDNRDMLSTKYVSYLGLNASISNQILRKYGRNKKIKAIHSVPLMIAKSNLRRIGNDLWIPPLKHLVKLPFEIKTTRGIEVTKDYVYIAYDADEAKQITPKMS